MTAVSPAAKARKYEYNKAYRDANPDLYRRASRRHAATRKELLRNLKLASGCVDCGYDGHADALDFDHRNPEEKRFTVSTHAARRPLAAVLAEIEKCDVVCANCHRIRTAERRAR